MLSAVSHGLTFGLSLYYFVMGAILFVFPERMSEVFAWKVSPFVTMTIGAWSLGNAWLALVAGWRWRWTQVNASLVYLWLFGVLQMGVALFFRDKLRLEHPIAWLYLGTLGFNVLAAIVGMVDWLRLRPPLQASGNPVHWISRIFLILFIIFVAFLGAFGVFAQQGWPGTNAGIFPEVLSMFTLRSFAVFYLSLSLSAVPLLWARGMASLLSYAFSAYGLIVTITAAALWNIELFDLSKRPGGLIYIGIYVVVGTLTMVYFIRYGTGRVKGLGVV